MKKRYKNSKVRKLLSAVLLILMTFSALFTPVQAATKESVNQLYKVNLTSTETAEIHQLAEQYGPHLKRTESFRFKLPTDLKTQFTASQIDDLILSAIYWVNDPNGGLCPGYYTANYDISFLGSGTEGGFVFNKKLISDKQEQQTEEKARQIIRSLPLQGKSLQEKERIIYNYMVKNVDSPTYKYEHTAYGALVQNKATCLGMADGYYLLCHTAGLNNVQIATGYLCRGKKTSYHAWNIVTYNEKNYIVDIGWKHFTLDPAKAKYDYDLADNGINTFWIHNNSK